LPFGSGAGVLYNYGDLQFKNNTEYTFLSGILARLIFFHRVSLYPLIN
jgi:hypothetical protein